MKSSSNGDPSVAIEEGGSPYILRVLSAAEEHERRLCYLQKDRINVFLLKMGMSIIEKDTYVLLIKKLDSRVRVINDRQIWINWKSS